MGSLARDTEDIPEDTDSKIEAADKTKTVGATVPVAMKSFLECYYSRGWKAAPTST